MHVALLVALIVQASTALSNLASSQTPDNGATFFGSCIDCIGDQNDDGHDDVAVSAPKAWSAQGRTGQVLILSGTDGSVLRGLHGDAGETDFGKSVLAIRSTSHSSPTRLAVGFNRRADRKLVNATKIISLHDGQIVATIPDAMWVIGSPGDLDGDRRLDYAIRFAGPSIWAEGSTRWHSGKTWQAIDRPEIPGRICLLDEDYDGDGIRDYLTGTKSEANDIQVCSGGSDERISMLKFRPNRDGSLDAVCIERKVDGKRAIVISNPDREHGSAALSAYSGVTGELEFETTFGKWSPVESDWLTFSLYSAPELDCNVFFAIRTPSWAEELQAYSGSTLELKWRAPFVVEQGCNSMAVLRSRRPPSGVIDTELAVAKLRIEYGGAAEPNGEVVILSAESGRVRKYFHERDYPTLSFDHYPELRESGKK